jgi:hypothetical protein
MTKRSLALAIFFFAATAHAEDTIDPQSLRAEKLAADAEQKIAQGAYAEAVELYVEAENAQASAVLLCNIATLYDRHLAAKAPAVAYYKRCAASPDVESSLASHANARIAALETPPPPPPPAEKTEWPAMRTWALVAGGAGVIALGIGTGFALSAKSKDDDASKYCDGDRCTDARAITLTHDATSAAHVADALFVTGAVLIAGGVVLWLLAPSKRVTARGVAVTF